MNPARSVALGLLLAGGLHLTRIGLLEEPQFALGYVFSVVSGLFVLLGSLYGLVRSEESPIVTEYGPLAYLLLFGSLLASVVSVVRILTA